MIKRILFFPTFVVLNLAACGGSKPADDATSVDTSSDDVSTGSNAETTPAPEVAWADMNRDQRMEYMGLTVLPEMKKVFQAADAEGYKDFKCQTCHGEDMQAVDYKMPNGLFALTKPDPIPASTEYDAATTKFMVDEVMPKMAKLMGGEPGTTFTCFNCHDSEE
jgi:hypothetical protein